MSSKPTDSTATSTGHAGGGDNPAVAFLDAQRGVVRSRKGGWRPGEGVFCHGREMMTELVGRASYMQVVILNATGRLPERRLAEWFEAVHICLSWPDPRIWCNQMGALGGTMRTTAVAATVSGILAADSRAYGILPLTTGVAFIQQALADHQGGLPAAEIVTRAVARHGGKPHIMGYARPLARGDERVGAMEGVAERLGFPVGAHLALAYAIEKELLARFQESMNINGYMSAFLSDQGFTPEEVYRVCAVLVTSGVTACYVDSAARPPGSFLPMRCDDVVYQGPPPRALPGAGD